MLKILEHGFQFLQAIYLLSQPNGSMKLFEFVIIFGFLMLVLAQIPSFHSLRHINLISLFLCLAYSACASAASIYIGNSADTKRTCFHHLFDSVINKTWLFLFVCLLFQGILQRDQKGIMVWKVTPKAEFSESSMLSPLLPQLMAMVSFRKFRQQLHHRWRGRCSKGYVFVTQYLSVLSSLLPSLVIGHLATILKAFYSVISWMKGILWCQNGSSWWPTSSLFSNYQQLA